MHHPERQPFCVRPTPDPQSCAAGFTRALETGVGRGLKNTLQFRDGLLETEVEPALMVPPLLHPLAA